MRHRVALFVCLLAALPTLARAQERTCDLIESGQIERRTEGGTVIIQFQDPFFFRCSDGAELRASSGRLDEGSRVLTLIGNVFFQDPEQTLTADDATYSSAAGRLEASGNVVFTNRGEGSELRGPELEYFRAMEGRPEARVNATRRPHLTLRPREGGAEEDPLELDADRVVIVGQNDLTAYGSVVIERPDLDASADEARYMEEDESLELRGNARIETEENQLSAEVIQARLEEGALEHVRAVTAASLRGERLTLDAPEVQLFFDDEVLQRTVARVRGGEGERAVAVARDFRMEADSLDALMPGQRLEQVVAIGRARGETVDTLVSATADTAFAAAADTSAVAPADSASLAVSASGLGANDWIAGDTVIGYFAPDTTTVVEDADSASVTLTRVVATGGAQSLYRVTPQGDPAATQGRRGINYLAGDKIELTFAGGELDVADVAGLQRGVYLDPIPTQSEETAPPDAGGGVEEPGLEAER